MEEHEYYFEISRETLDMGMNQISMNQFLEISETSAFKMHKKLDITLISSDWYRDDTNYTPPE